MCPLVVVAITLQPTITFAVQFNSLQTLHADLGDTGVLTFSPEDPVPSTNGDGCIYAVNSTQGKVRRICFNASKAPFSTTDVVDLNGASGVNLLLGITIDPTMPNGEIHLYLAYSDDNTAPFNGKIARAVSTNQGSSFTTDEDFIVGLPRSNFDHQTNGLEFGPDGCLYIMQGGNSNAGYDSAFAESRLSAALLRACFKNSDGTVNGSFVRNCGGGNTQSPCDVKVYASGLRNPFDLLWHSNGFLYATDNDSNPGFRDSCPNVANTFGCACQAPIDKLGDEINRIEQGKYYGSPNPYRANPAGVQCNGGANGSDACPPANCATGGGSCQNLSGQCTAADSNLCGQQVQCYYFGGAQSGPDPNNLYRAPIAQVSDLRFDGFAEYSQRFPKLALGGFCSDWDRDLLATGAPDKVRRFDLAANGLTATIGPPSSPAADRGTQNIEGLSSPLKNYAPATDL